MSEYDIALVVCPFGAVCVTYSLKIEGFGILIRILGLVEDWRRAWGASAQFCEVS